MKKNICKVMILFITGMIGCTIPVQAKGEEGYSVSPVLSEYQSKGITSFFDINWQPQKSDEFGIKITNKSNEEQVYTIQVNKARTNINGMIDYAGNQKERKSTEYKITEMVEFPKEVKVGAKSDKIITGKVIFGSKDFNGLLMAGIHVSKNSKEKTTTGVSNNVSYNIPFVVRGNIDKRPTPKIELIKTTVEQLTTSQYALNILLNNIKSNLLKDVKFTALIEDSKGNILETQESKIDITPETKFIYPLKLTSKYSEGNYMVKLKMTHGKKDKWDFQSEFQLSNGEASNIENIKNNKENNINWYIIIGGLLIFISIIIFVIVRLRKK